MINNLVQKRKLIRFLEIGTSISSRRFIENLRLGDYTGQWLMSQTRIQPRKIHFPKVMKFGLSKEWNPGVLIPSPVSIL